MNAPRRTRHEERRDMIVTLLRTLRDAGETLQRGDGGGKIKLESREFAMPAAFNAGSYDELLKALAKLRKLSRTMDGARGAYWNVLQRYIVSERLTKNLINVGGSYFDAVKLTETPDAADGFNVRWRAGDPKPANMEILSGVAQPRVAVAHKPGARAVFVRAVVERWDPRVERRPLETGLDSLAFLMPATIRLPRDVRVAA